MAQAIVNPQHVLQFAHTLKRYSSDVSSQTSDVNAKLHSLGETWRDQEYQKFAKEFETAIRAIKRFVTAGDGYHRYLVRKAEAAQAYLDRQ
jgi:uncharacterized protein YukE